MARSAHSSATQTIADIRTAYSLVASPQVVAVGVVAARTAAAGEAAARSWPRPVAQAWPRPVG